TPFAVSGITADRVVAFVAALRVQPVEPQERIIDRVRVENLTLLRPRPGRPFAIAITLTGLRIVLGEGCGPELPAGLEHVLQRVLAVEQLLLVDVDVKHRILARGA